MSEDRGPCALWYVRYATPGYELYDSEQDAAASAFHMVDGNHASPAGVQFPDGITIPVEEWPALRAYEQRIFEEERQRADQAPSPQPVMRTVRDPFSGRSVEVEADAPDWLGTR